MSIDASRTLRTSTSASGQSFLRSEQLLPLVLTFILYVTAGRIGLSVPFTSANVSPVWPAAGVALASVLTWGYRVWPAIASGVFLVNLFGPIPPVSAFGITLGNTVSAIFGGYLLRRVAGFQLSLARMRDVLALVIFGAVVSPILAASIGVTSLFLSHVHAWSGFASAWPVWWLGDAMGVLIVTPLFLTIRELGGFLKGARLIELVLLLVGLLAVCLAVFGGHMGFSVQDDVLAFVAFPFVIWAAIRFRVAGAALTTLLITAVAVWGTALGDGPFVKHDPLHNAVLLQLFIAVTSTTGLILAAVITEGKHSAEQLREQAELLDLANDAILVRTLDDKITYWNNGAERLYGWSRQEVLGRLTHDILRTQFPQPFSEIKAQLLRGGSWQGEITHSKRDGNRIAVASRWSVWRNKRGKPLGFLELNTDITDRKRAEENLRSLSGRLLKLQDDERRRIARELHDSAGQLLVALGMNLASLDAEAEHLSPRARWACKESLELVQQMSTELRTLSHLLHPPLLDEAGLPSAVRWYVEGFAERSKIAVNLELSPDLGRLLPEAETAVFRIVQECLTNIHRHSGSTTASIRVTRDPQEIKVEVRDEGKGMPSRSGDPPEFRRTGVGIQGMRERIRQLGGRLEISSSKNGTVIVAMLPASTPVQSVTAG